MTHPATKTQRRKAILDAVTPVLNEHWIGGSADLAFADNAIDFFDHVDAKNAAGQGYGLAGVREHLIDRINIFTTPDCASAGRTLSAADRLLTLHGISDNESGEPTYTEVNIGAAALKADSNWHAGFEDGGFNYAEAARIVLRAANASRRNG